MLLTRLSSVGITAQSNCLRCCSLPIHRSQKTPPRLSFQFVYERGNALDRLRRDPATQTLNYAALCSLLQAGEMRYSI